MLQDNWLRRDWNLSARMLVAIAASAVLIKVLLLFVALPLLNNASPTTYQAERFPDWYDLLAKNLVEGNGYRFYPETTQTMLRTPGWPLILAGLFGVFGYGITAIKAFNLLCSIGTASLTYALGKRIAGNRTLAGLSALIAFLHPATMVADSRGGVESIFTLGLMLFAFMVYRALATESLKGYVVAGLLLGAVLLIKSTAALFVPCVFLCQAIYKPTLKGIRKAVITTSAMGIAAGLVLSPWIARNYLLSGHFVPTMNVGSMSAWCGLYIATHRDTGREQHELDVEASDAMGVIAKNMGLRFKPGYYPQFYSIEDEVAFYRHLGETVRSEYRKHPGTYLDVIADNAVGFWIRGRTQKATMLNTILVVPLLGLAILGAIIAQRRRLPVLPIVLFAGALFATHMLIQGQARYHVPLIPLLSILCVVPFLRPDRPARAPV